MNEREDVINFLKGEAERLQTQKRFSHTLGVLSECEYFCDVFALSDEERYVLRRAALLHDITKCFSDEEQLCICRAHNIDRPLSPTLHQETGACYISEKYNDIVDDEVISAVKKHTTGDESMSICDMVLFISDFTEPGRKYDDCIKMREYIHAECEKIDKKDRSAVNLLLCKAVAMICEISLSHISGEVDSRTENTKNAMRRILEENCRG